MTATLSESSVRSYGDAFPSSTKVYVEGSRGIRVPMREIALSGGEPPAQQLEPSPNGTIFRILELPPGIPPRMHISPT